MINKKYILAVLAMSVCLSLVGSCAKGNEPIEHKTEIEPIKPQGEFVQLDLSGEYEAGQATEARYISTTNEEGIKITLSDTELQNPKKLRLFLVQEEKPDIVTSVYVTPTITKLSSGKYRIRYQGDVQLAGQGQSFAQGTWYVGGIYGYNTEDNNSTFSLPGNKTFIFLANGATQELNLPLTLGWTRLYTKQAPAAATASATKATANDMNPLSPDLGRNFALRYEPDGVLIRVRSINGLLSPTPISQVMMETNEFSVGPAKYPAVSGLTAQKLRAGGAPTALTATTTTATNNLYRVEATVPAEDRFLMQGQALPKDVYIWAHETPRTYQANTQTRLWLNANGLKATKTDRNGNIIGSDDSWGGEWPVEKRLTGFKPDSNKLILEDYSDYDKADQGGRKSPNPRGATRYRLYGGDRSYILKKKTSDAPYKRGTIYPTNLEVTSDLMISEVFVEKAYSVNFSNTDPVSPVASYALLEIYNPSLRDIDLSEYGLIRIYSRDEKNHKYVCPGIPTPSGKQPGDLVDQALVLPLNPAAGYGTVWEKNGLGVKPDGKKWNVNGAYQRPKPITTYTGYNVQYKDYGPTLGADALTASSILAPGKTMIVLSSKYLLENYTPNAEQDGYKTVGNQRVPEIFKQIKQAVDQGYCQYVFAANNAKDLNARPNQVGSGVMTVGLVDFFSIVKVRSLDKERTFIDSDWLYWWSPDMEMESTFFKRVGGNGKSYVRKRRLPLIGNNSILSSQDYLNRTVYEVGGSANYSTFGVAEYNEYQPTWNYATRIQPLIGRKESARLK